MMRTVPGLRANDKLKIDQSSVRLSKRQTEVYMEERFTKRDQDANSQRLLCYSQLFVLKCYYQSGDVPLPDYQTPSLTIYAVSTWHSVLGKSQSNSWILSTGRSRRCTAIDADADVAMLRRRADRT
jgi:hypothetical protein